MPALPLVGRTGSPKRLIKGLSGQFQHGLVPGAIAIGIDIRKIFQLVVFPDPGAFFFSMTITEVYPARKDVIRRLQPGADDG